MSQFSLIFNLLLALLPLTLSQLHCKEAAMNRSDAELVSFWKEGGLLSKGNEAE